MEPLDLQQTNDNHPVAAESECNDHLRDAIECAPPP